MSTKDFLGRLLMYADSNTSTDGEDGGDDFLEIPTELGALPDEELDALATRASDAFDGIYGDGSSDFSAEELATLATLTEGIEALAAERAARDEAAEARRTAAAEFAARVRPEDQNTVQVNGASLGDVTEVDEEPAGDDELATDDEDLDDDDEPEAGPTAPATSLVASTRARIPMPRQPKRRPSSLVASGSSGGRTKEKTMRDVAFSTADFGGFTPNQPMDWDDAGRLLDKRLASFSLSTYQNAAKRGQHLREQGSLMAFKREIPKELMVDGENGDAAIKHAVDMNRLPGNSLVAAGWCAPSEILYDLCAPESRDGLYSLPEVGISRGGVKFPVDPTFASIYSAPAFFHFTEEDAIAGKYTPGAAPGDPNVVGPKPCFEVPCPTWDEERLEADGVCITGDIVQQRGYPEALARYQSGILIAHDHRISASQIARVQAGSTAITMGGGSGTTAPLLAAIELQVEHYRYVGRLLRSTTLEAVFPYWIRGAIRQDLSVRLGVELLAVTDAQIDAWFSQRGVAPQFVYDWQALDVTPIGTFLTWPDEVTFLLYLAGTWVRGVDDLITLDNVYDSTQLGENKYTALFTEESWLLMKRCTDSRAVTVPVCSDGSTHAGILLECDLTPTPAG